MPRLPFALVFAAAVVAPVLSCGPSAPPRVGRFQVDVSERGFTVRSGERVLLESFEGEGGYGPFASRANTTKWEMQYGSWKITDGNTGWSSATSFTGATEKETFKGSFRDGTGELATIEMRSPEDGVLELEVKSLVPKANRTALAFKCAESDRFVGFGGQSDALDHRGHTIPLWTSEPGIGKTAMDSPSALWMLEGARHGASYGLPTWLSDRGFIGVLNSDSRSIFELCSVNDAAYRIENWQNELKLVLYDGPSPKEALTRGTGGILGRPPTPPPVAFAPWNDAVFGEVSVRQVAELLRTRNLPSSVLWTEDFRGGEDRVEGYRLIEEWDLDRSLYPNAEAFSAELRAKGFSWHAYFNTFVVTDTRIHAASLAGNHLVKTASGAPYLFEGVTFKPTGLADLSRAETREFVKGYLRTTLDQGFDGWMADYGEWLPHDAQLSSGESAQLAHNRYPHEWAKLNAEVLAERPKDGRQLLYFIRAGWLGTTAYAPVVWAGDQRTDFQKDDGLPTVIPMGLNFGLAGVSTYGHDIAGYQSATNPASTKELFFRWTSLGALSPVMRTHHGIKARENWWFGKDEETIAHYGRWAREHIQLFPYFDGASVEAEQTGVPLMRALLLEFPNDAQGWSRTDEYLLGPSLLVAPVIEAGAVSRKVHFPEGRWYPLNGGAAIDGPVELDVPAPLTELPSFGRAGGIIPMLPETIQTLLPANPPTVDLEDVNGRRTLRVFPGAAGSFTERDGTRYALTTDGTDGFTQAGAALPPCTAAAQRGCVEAKTANAPRRVRLNGSEPLQFPGGKLELSGPPREVDVLVFGS